MHLASRNRQTRRNFAHYIFYVVQQVNGEWFYLNINGERMERVFKKTLSANSGYNFRLMATTMANLRASHTIFSHNGYMVTTLDVWKANQKTTKKQKSRKRPRTPPPPGSSSPQEDPSPQRSRQSSPNPPPSPSAVMVFVQSSGSGSITLSEL